MWFFFSLLAALLWGVGQVFAKRGLSYTSPLFNNLLATVVDVVFWMPVALTGGVEFGKFPAVFPLAVVAGATYFVYYYVITKGEISLTGTIQATYPLTTIILSAIFLHEQTNLFQKLATLLVISGSILIAIPNDKNLLKKFQFADWVYWAIAGSILIGFGDFLAKVAINKSNAYTWLFFLALAYLPCAFINFLLDKKGRFIPEFNLKKLLPSIIGVAMIGIGIIPFNLAFQYGLASLVGPISSSYVVLTAILAFVFLKERINRIQLLGILSTFSGIVLLGIVQF